MQTADAYGHGPNAPVHSILAWRLKERWFLLISRHQKSMLISKGQAESVGREKTTANRAELKITRNVLRLQLCPWYVNKIVCDLLCFVWRCGGNSAFFAFAEDILLPWLNILMKRLVELRLWYNGRGGTDKEHFLMLSR